MLPSFWPSCIEERKKERQKAEAFSALRDRETLRPPGTTVSLPSPAQSLGQDRQVGEPAASPFGGAGEQGGWWEARAEVGVAAVAPGGLWVCSPPSPMELTEWLCEGGAAASSPAGGRKRMLAAEVLGQEPWTRQGLCICDRQTLEWHFFLLCSEAIL